MCCVRNTSKEKKREGKKRDSSLTKIRLRHTCSQTQVPMDFCSPPLLVEELENSRPCHANVSFGCITDTAMWASFGCRARFHCGRAAVLMVCGNPKYHHRYNCSCVRSSRRAMRRFNASRERESDALWSVEHPPRSIEQLPYMFLRAQWKTRGIFHTDLDRTERWVSMQSRFTSPGAFRVKLINGTLWVKMLHVRPQWLERTSVCAYS